MAKKQEKAQCRRLVEEYQQTNPQNKRDETSFGPPKNPIVQQGTLLNATAARDVARLGRVKKIFHLIKLNGHIISNYANLKLC